MPGVLNLKKSNCKNCHRCIRKCPVKSIRFTGHQAHIISDECILCGQCFVVCPQEAKEIIDDRERVGVMLQGEAPVIASFDPSFYACWEGCGANSVRKALIELGFTDAEETAIGATIVKREYERMLREAKQDVIITSACASLNLLIEKHFPELRRYLAPVVSPMIAHAMDIKRRMPEAKVVFIGPCVAKKQEYEGTCVDAVLTFEEFDQMRISAGIEIEHEFGESFPGRARSFPVTGGIIRSMDIPDTGYQCIATNGPKNCMNALNDLQNGNIHKCFIELAMCDGSCIEGPIMEKYINSPIRHIYSVWSNVGKEDFDVPQPESEQLRTQYIGTPVHKKTPSEAEIREILSKLGKNTKADELNCGSCGYNTCREKAIAICHGKAEISMCLPFLKEKAESFSDCIVGNTPNGIVVVNEAMEVQQINNAALRMMNIRSASDLLGDQLNRVLDPAPFLEVLRSGRSIHNRRTYLAEYKRYVEETVVFDQTCRLLVAIMRDVTDEESEREKKESLNRQTIEVADRVVDKQMRIVQEIASLLGETAAETKIALTKLKESISDE